MDNGDQRKINSNIPTKTLEELHEVLTKTHPDPDLSVSFENPNALIVYRKKEPLLHVSRKV